MKLIDPNMLSSKFRGALIGGLLGDCLGSPFEGDIFDKGLKLTLKNYIDKLEGPYFKTPIKQYTDDTAMTRSIVTTLVDKVDIDQKYLATSFVREYFNSPKRGYGQAVVDVFHKLRTNKCEDPIGPAREQFDGSGSYGNGAAMRIAPIGLFCHNKPIETLIDLARKSSVITHSNKLAIHGAILQAMAVQQSLSMDPSEEFDGKGFIQTLIKKFDQVENDEDFGIKLKMPYHVKLEKILYFLDNPERAHDTGVIESLGNSIVSLDSVPTAIYCFIRGQNEIDGIKTNNKFRRTIEYAFSLGGDTDTIGCMAGSICGAYHGDEIIPENLLKHCESSDEIKHLANQLLAVSK